MESLDLEDKIYRFTLLLQAAKSKGGIEEVRRLETLVAQSQEELQAVNERSVKGVREVEYNMLELQMPAECAGTKPLRKISKSRNVGTGIQEVSRTSCCSCQDCDGLRRDGTNSLPAFHKQHSRGPSDLYLVLRDQKKARVIRRDRAGMSMTGEFTRSRNGPQPLEFEPEPELPREQTTSRNMPKPFQSLMADYTRGSENNPFWKPVKTDALPETETQSKKNGKRKQSDISPLPSPGFQLKPWSGKS